MASKFVVHIYGEAEVLDGEPDPLIHGEGVFPTGPDNVTVTYRKKADTSDDEPAEPTVSRPRHSPAPASPDQPEEPRDAEQACAAPHKPADHDSPAGPPEPQEAQPSKCVAASGYLPGFRVVPNALIAALVEAGAKVRRIRAPGIEPSESYRVPSAQREYVQARDLCCRVPGCDRPIDETDLDHTIAWGDGGPTHVSNIKGYCRHHHIVKTFRDGWSDVQKTDGTIVLSTPTGHTYISIPTSRLLFPSVNTTSARVQRGRPRKEQAADKTAKMPKRKRSKPRTAPTALPQSAR